MTPMPARLISILAVAALPLAAGCGDSDSDGDSSGANERPVPNQIAGEVPDMPAEGESRPGRSYRIAIEGANGETQVFQVIEPKPMVGGARYPLVLEGHGFGGSRQTDASGGDASAANLASLVNNGYGVISIDQRGHGESGGTIRAMDPDFEGRNLVRILDWAEANLDWLATGPDADAGKDNLLLGAVGLSYGGGFQLVLNAIDPEKRMDAMVPQITWHNLTSSLNPGDVIKVSWVLPLFGAGSAAGDGFNFDPFINDVLIEAALSNRISDEGEDFFRYHGQGYFCDGQSVATNGGVGTEPDFPPQPPGAVHAMFWQGFRDTLFPFNEAFANFECLRRAGGDVRLLTYQSGHNTIPVVPDPGAIGSFSPDFLTTISDTACGGVGITAATLAFFDEHLKGQEGAADDVPEICLSLSAHDDIMPESVTTGRDGRELSVPRVDLITGLLPPIDVPQPAVLGFAAGSGELLAGIPRAELEVERQAGTDPATGEPILFVGVGRRPSGGVAWELVDNQIQPIRGLGTHEFDLGGVAERLQPGDELALLVYAAHDQYSVSGGLSLGGLLSGLEPALSGDLADGNLLDLPTVPVTVSGRVWMPVTEAPAQ